MQSAYDRDDHVSIKWENIISGYENNFDKYVPEVISHFNGTYDYDSIMHYGAYGFSKNKKPTIVPLVSELVCVWALIHLSYIIKQIDFDLPFCQDETYLTLIGQRNHLNDEDIAKLNVMYECSAVKPDANSLVKKAFEWEKQMIQE